MNATSIIWRFWAALALGVFFYAGLSLTVRFLPQARHPVVLTLVSFWTRMLTVLAGFLFMIKERWEYGVICLAGFTVGRAATLKFLARQEPRTKCT